MGVGGEARTSPTGRRAERAQQVSIASTPRPTVGHTQACSMPKHAVHLSNLHLCMKLPLKITAHHPTPVSIAKTSIDLLIDAHAHTAHTHTHT